MYQEIDHLPSETCEMSAKQRGKDQSIGGKSILFKAKNGYHLFVLSAVLKIDSNKVRKILKCQKLRFATNKELYDLASVTKGGLPPFGYDLLPFDLYLDQSILNNKEIAFNAGILTKSFILKVEDYLKLVKPKICSFSKL